VNKKWILLWIFVLLLAITYYSNILILQWDVQLNPRYNYSYYISNKEIHLVRQIYGIKVSIYKMYNFYYRKDSQSLGEVITSILLSWKEIEYLRHQEAIGV
jgi:hypothetical protein